MGVLMGATSRIVASSQTPDQKIGFVNMSGVFLMSFMIAGVGTAVGLYGLQGGYLFAGLAALAFTVLMLSYQGPAPTEPDSGFAHTPLKPGLRPIAVILMGMLFVTSSGMGFAFMFTIALDLGMEYSSEGSFIGGLVLVSALACQVGGWCLLLIIPSRAYGKPYNTAVTSISTFARSSTRATT